MAQFDNRVILAQMTERKGVLSIPPEELHGAVLMTTEEELSELRNLYRDKKFDPDLLRMGHDSQAGRWVRYEDRLLFVEADSPDFDPVQVTQKLLGFAELNQTGKKQN